MDILAAIDYLSNEAGDSKLIIHPVMCHNIKTESLPLIEDEYELVSPKKLYSKVKHMTSIENC
jgi:hypothetical protein